MRAALLYASTNGRTRKVVTAALEALALAPEVFDVKEGVDPARLAECELLLFFCPTYGDEELQEDMEDFIAAFALDCTGRKFAICELGNFYGYDDFSFGAMRIIRRRLLELNASELCEPLSLDSFPQISWSHLDAWVKHLNGKLQQHVGP